MGGVYGPCDYFGAGQGAGVFGDVIDKGGTRTPHDMLAFSSSYMPRKQFKERTKP